MAKAMEVRTTGLDKVLENLNALPEQIISALGRALYQEGEGLMAEAKPITPIDTGVLRSSGFVKPPAVTDNDIVVEVGFGGAAASYALIVHERLDAYHNPPTQAKYLEEPFNRRTKGYNERIARAVIATLK